MAENNNETQKVTKTFPDGGRAVLTIDRNGVILDYQLERGTQTSTSLSQLLENGKEETTAWFRQYFPDRAELKHNIQDMKDLAEAAREFGTDEVEKLRDLLSVLERTQWDIGLKMFPYGDAVALQESVKLLSQRPSASNDIYKLNTKEDYANLTKLTQENSGRISFYLSLALAYGAKLAYDLSIYRLRMDKAPAFVLTPSGPLIKSDPNILPFAHFALPAPFTSMKYKALLCYFFAPRKMHIMVGFDPNTGDLIVFAEDYESPSGTNKIWHSLEIKNYGDGDNKLTYTYNPTAYRPDR